MLNIENYLPKKTEEAWKYTSLQEIKKIDWKISDQEVNLSHDELKHISAYIKPEFTNIVFIDGFYNKTLSDSDFDQLKIEKTFEKDFIVVDTDVENQLKNLMKNFAKEKNVIQIDQSLKQPLQIIQVLSKKSSTVIQPLTQVHIAKGCQAKLIQSFISLNGGSSQLMNNEIHIFAAENSEIKFINSQNLSATDFIFSRIYAHAKNHAQIKTFEMALGARISRHNLNLYLEGEQAQTSILGLSLLSDDQHCDHYTFIQHQKGHNESFQHYKSILADKSRSVFRGRVRIEQDAQKANSAQLNNNLLLSRAAEADSIPQLEIYADDVKAGHGSTVGQLNKDEVFYFLSRGISEQEAIKMISYGYAKEIIFKLENAELEKFALDTLNTKLTDIF